jgi:hypothetical protein
MTLLTSQIETDEVEATTSFDSSAARVMNKGRSGDVSNLTWHRNCTSSSVLFWARKVRSSERGDARIAKYNGQSLI